MNICTGLRLIYIIGTYPLLTTTFIDREINALRRMGVNATVVSIRQPHGILSAEQEKLRQEVIYLLPVSIISFLVGNLYFIFTRPVNYFSTLLFLLRQTPGSLQTRLKALQHFAAGVQTAHLVRKIPSDHVHAHFADRATTVALVVSHLLDLTYSFTAHANDIYVSPVLLSEKIAQAKFVATCTGYNESHLLGMGNGQSSRKIKRIYHGLDASQYQREQREPPKKPIVLAVGQLKEKKGFTYLLEACRILREQDYEFECHIVGEGPLRAMLETKIWRLGLEDTVYLQGALPHQAVVDAYGKAAMFVLPAVVSQDGDRDGIPNVILEAEAMELPIVSTRHSGIPEVVIDGHNGLLVEPADEVALAEAMAKLLEDSALRAEMGQRGRQFVTENFDVDRNAKSLLDAILA